MASVLSWIVGHSAGVGELLGDLEKSYPPAVIGDHPLTVPYGQGNGILPTLSLLSLSVELGGIGWQVYFQNKQGRKEVGHIQMDTNIPTIQSNKLEHME